MRLEFPSYNHDRHARVGHGDDCVLLMLEDADYHQMPGFIVLRPDEAHALGVRLQQQARSARAAHREREAAP